MNPGPLDRCVIYTGGTARQRSGRVCFYGLILTPCILTPCTYLFRVCVACVFSVMSTVCVPCYVSVCCVSVLCFSRPPLPRGVMWVWGVGGGVCVGVCVCGCVCGWECLWVFCVFKTM